MLVHLSYSQISPLVLVAVSGLAAPALADVPAAKPVPAEVALPVVDANKIADSRVLAPWEDPTLNPAGNSGADSRPNATDLGLVDNSTILVNVSTPLPFTQINIAIFDSFGTLVVGAAQPPVFLIPQPLAVVAPVPPGTYYVATWAGGGTAANGFSVPGGNGGLPLNLDFLGGTTFSVSPGPVGGAVGFSSVVVQRPTTETSNAVITNFATFDLTTEGSNFDTELALFTSGGTLVASDDDSGTGTVSALNNLDLSAGVYYAAITGFDTSFGSRFVTNTPATGTTAGSFLLNINNVPIGGGGVLSGRFEFSDFRIREEGSGSDLGNLIASVQPLTFTTPGSMVDTEIAVWDLGTGELVATDDDSGAGTDSSLTLNLAPGEYLAAVNGFSAMYDDRFLVIAEGDGDAGPYNIEFARPGEVAFSNTGESINPAGDTDYFRFTVDAVPDLGAISDELLANINTAGSNFDTEIAVFSAAPGRPLIAQDDDNGIGTTSLIVRSYEPGQYFLAVTGFDATFANDLAILANGVINFGNYTGSFAGTPFNGTVAANDRYDIFSFSVFDQGSPAEAVDLGVIGDQGVMLEINTNGATFDTLLGVFAGDGDLLAQDDDSGLGQSSAIVRSYEAGTYFFAVSGFANAFSDGFGVGTLESNFGSFAGSANSVPFSGSIASRESRFYRFEIAGPCSAADLSPVFGTLDINDILTFANAFNAQSSVADFFADGIFDINDLLIFAGAFNAGCP